jgi:hypothetical protein
MPRTLLLIGLLQLVVLGSLPAQRASPPFAQWTPSAEFAGPTATGLPQPDSIAESRGDYRYEGLAFGGLVFGALGAWLGSRDFAGACPLEPGTPCGGNRDNLGNGIAVGLVGAAVGGGVGYLVGRLSPKRDRPPSILPGRSPDPVILPDSLRRAGYQHWRGAGIGAAIGGVVGALTGAVLGGNHCSDCEPMSSGQAALVVGLLGAGGGGVVGFLAGLSSPKYERVPAAGNRNLQ